MFGSRPTVGAVSIPATAPRSAASPHPRPSIHGTRTPTSRASSGLTAAALQREPDLRELEQRPEQEDDSERDHDRPDVLRGDDDPSDVVDVGPEGTLQLLRLAAPLPDDEAVDRDEQPDRDDHDPQDAPALDRPDHGGVDADPTGEREGERRDERRPVAPAVVEGQRPGDVRRQRRHLALREVDDAGRAVDDHERQRQERVDPARREAGHDLLHEVGERGGDHQYPR